MTLFPIRHHLTPAFNRWFESFRTALSTGIVIVFGLPNPSLVAQEDIVRPPALKLEVVAGQAATNNIKSRKGVEPIVLVTDERGQPVSNVMVVFTLPETGAGGGFADGSKRAIVYTDSEGKARARGFAPNSTAGKFQIAVNASFHGFTASTAVEQTNFVPEGSKGISSKLIAILAIAGGAAVAGAVVASGGGNSVTSNPVPPASSARTSTTITPGTPVFGPPQ